MKNKSHKIFLLLLKCHLIITAIIAIDYFSKDLIFQLLLDHVHNGKHAIILNKFFYLAIVKNKGVSFGALSHLSKNSILIISGIAIFLIYLFMISICYHINNNRSFNNKIKKEAVMLSLIIGGGFGNLLERYNVGYVFDFLIIHYKEYEFPAFNLADTFVSLGVMCLIIIHFIYNPRKK